MTSEPLHEAATYERQGPPNSLPQEGTQDKPATAHWERILLSLWFIVNLAIGAATVQRYGIALDEPNNYRYGADALDAYKSLFGILYEPAYNSTYDGHGPVFDAGTELLVRAVRSIFPQAFETDIWHFSYFITFLLTGLCLYALMKRWFHAWTAWGVLILFSTQPLLLGYAFIDPKDIPFMFFFALSILLGFRVADRPGTMEQFVSLSAPFQSFRDKLQETNPSRSRRFLLHLGIATALLVLLIVFSSVLSSMVDQAVRFFYRASPDSWAGRVFSMIATHGHDLTGKDYASQAQRLFIQAERIALLAGVLLFLIYFGVTFPAVLHAAWGETSKLGGILRRSRKLLALPRSAVNLRWPKQFLAEMLDALRQPRVILAGTALGVATSIRAVAPWAGAIAFLYLLMKMRARAWAIGVAYFLVTGVVTYLTWPRLWGAPLQRFLEGVGKVSNFPTAQHVLFNGRVYPADALPGSYVWTFLNIQLTETLVACAYIGVGILVWQMLRSRVRTDLLLYIGLGFAAPLIGWEVLRSPLYDNLRQLLFLIPAMVMLAAFTFELAIQKITRTWLRLLLIAAIALPGIYASSTLYPYEYVYFNSLAGGLAGASKLYPLDPWRISLREVALELNQRAPYGAKIYAGPWAELMGVYTRPDLVLDKIYNEPADLNGEYGFSVEVANVKPRGFHHDTEDVFVVRRGDAVLATLRAVNNASTK
jgi:hypothetical protein